jgi:YaiO family outer membrane protein
MTDRNKGFGISLLVLLLLSLFALPSFGQEIANVDDAFAAARKLGFSGKHAEARALSRKILLKSPDYAEVAVFIGRLYIWDHQYDSARAELARVIQAHPDNSDALNALVDLEYWSGDSRKAIQYCNDGLRLHPDAPDFLLKKSKAVADTGNVREAYNIVNSLLKLQPGNAAAHELAESLKRKLRMNSAGLKYDLDIFNKTYDPWHQGALYVSHRTPSGSVILRLNYGYRFNESALQYEADYYPHLTKKMYAYLNAGYSASSIFPTYRGGASLYRSFPKAFEGDLGFRYLYFSSSTIIYTGAIGKYISNFWFSARAYITPGNQGLSNSYSLLTRYYFNGADNYLTLTIGTGFSPDEHAAGGLLISTAYLNSKKVQLGIQKRIGKTVLLTAKSGYELTTVTPGEVRADLSFSLGIDTQF